MPRQAVLVLGPESSGTRLVTRIFLAAGYWGDGDHAQRLENGETPPPSRNIVWRKSYPHGENWPNAVELARDLRDKGFEVHAVVVMRDSYCCTRSQRARGHSNDKLKSRDAYRKAMLQIFKQVSEALLVSWITVSYSELILRGARAAKKLVEQINPYAKLDFTEKIVDENLKYYRP